MWWSPSTRSRPGANAAGIAARERVPRGHKMATAPIALNEPVYKYGQIIGFASKPIEPGQWVHEHNVAMQDFARDYRFAEGARNDEILPARAARHFRGLCAAERQDRHAQLHRHAHLGELLGLRRRNSSPRPSTTPTSWPTTRKSTASSLSCMAPAAAWRPTAKASRCCGGRNGATPRIPTSAAR